MLLDTSYLYDLMVAPGKLLDVERRFLGGPAVRLHVSAVSIWEMRLKHDARYRSGARRSPFDSNAVLTVLEDQEVMFVPMTMRRAPRMLDVPLRSPRPVRRIAAGPGAGRGPPAAHGGPLAGGPPPDNFGPRAGVGNFLEIPLWVAETRLSIAKDQPRTI